MTESARLVTVGTTNGGSTPIQADVTSLGGAVAVTLSTDYALLDPPGYPFRASFTGSRAPDLQYPRTVVSGSTISVLKCEADALVNAGAAALA